MAPKGLALRNIDQEIDDLTCKRYAWRVGSIPPFASLWITVLRFSLLNRPKFGSLNADLQGDEAAQLRSPIKFGSRLPWPLHETIDIRTFARMLGEPLEVFRWSSIGDFPSGFQDLFERNTKVCPSCMAQGFHTVIFSLGCIQRCPYHGEALLNRCPNCGKLLNDQSKAYSGIVPRLCACGHEWLTDRLARRPPSDASRDASMADVVAWTEKVASRCWAYVPKRPQIDHSLQLDTLHDHMDRWRAELKCELPDWLSLTLQAHPADEGLEQCWEHSGFRASSLATLKGAGSTYFSANPQALPWELQKESLLIYKCIRRYLVKHVLGNRVGLLVWMGKNQSAPQFRKCIQENPFAHIAWAILYWMQSTFWGAIGARMWFKKVLGLSMLPRMDWDPTYHWGPTIQDQVLVNAGTGSEEWIVNWINVFSLLETWPTQKDLETFATDDGFMRATHSRLRRLPVRWWAWLGEDECLHLGLYRRRPNWWEPMARRLSKEDRREEFGNKMASRLQELCTAMSAPCLRRLDDGSWTQEGARAFACSADIRRGRLMFGSGPASSFGVGLDPSLGADPARPWFVKSLVYPVCVLAPDVKAGVLKLKLAVRAYLGGSVMA